MRKFSGVRYVSWSPWIEKLHVLEKVGVQHQILDPTKVCEEIILPRINLAFQKSPNITVKADENTIRANIQSNAT